MVKEKKSNLFIFVFILGVSLFLSYHVYYYCLDMFNNDKVESYIIDYNVIDSHPKEIKSIKKIKNYNLSNDYLGVLIIPKINFKKGFYKIDDQRNNVNQNIEVLKGSKMPNVKGSSLIIAGHKGQSYLGYFNDLDKLVVNDTIEVIYDNNLYQYLVFDIYEVEKNGKISFNKNINENYLVLTTCSKKDNQQLVVVSKLIKNI